MKKSKKIAIVLVVVLAVVVLDIPDKIFTKVDNKVTDYQTAKTDEEFEEYMDNILTEPMDWSGYIDDLKNTMSDIEGMSQYDKSVAGLSHEDDSDTDNDGLTDKEEIEVYHSDPLKTSTAGDLYFDGYKVEHGMDLFTYYEYEGDFQYPEYVETAKGDWVKNELYSDTIKLHPTAPESACVSICTSTNIIPEEFDIYQEFDIRSFTGTLSFDFSTMDTLKDVKTFDILVMNQGTDNLCFCDYNINDSGLVDLFYDFEYLNGYYIIIGKSDMKNKEIGTSVRFDTNSLYISGVSYKNIQSDELNERYLITGSPLLTFVNVPLTVYYASENEPSKKEDVVQFTNDLIDGRSCANLPINFKKKSFLGLDIRYSVLSSLIPSFENKGTDFKYRYLIYCYCDYNASHSVFEQIKAEKEQDEYLSHFIPEIDQLPFSNFASEYSKNGHCAGITHLTSYLYNNKTFPSSGSSIIDNNEVQWNLTTDEENVTLMDRGLSDYKNADFLVDYVDQNGNIQKTITAGEQEFVKMIACYWTEANERIDVDSYLQTTKHQYDYDLIRNMKKYIDEGKILDVYLFFNHGDKHAVNIYDYYYDDNNPDIIHFKVYDSNFPISFIHDHLGIFNSITLDIYGTKDIWGKYETFTYQYVPVKHHPEYQAISTDGQNLFFFSRHGMVVVDDQWNVLNDQ